MRTWVIKRPILGLAILLALLIVILTGLVSTPADQANAQGGAVSYYLQIDGIEGESTARGHEKWIEVNSFSWGETNHGTALGGGGGKVSMRDFNFTMKATKATPKLFLAVAKGNIIRSATFTAVDNATGIEFRKWEFQNVVISNFKTEGSTSSSPVPTESLSMNFTKIIVTHTTQNADGTLSVERVGYDLAKAKAI